MTNASGDHKIAPIVLWAQRRDKIFLTLDIGDVKTPTIKVEDKSLFFSAVAGPESKHYEVTLNFYAGITPDECKHKSTGRVVTFSLKKTEAEFWPKLCSDTKRPHYVKVDFEKWKDEDDSDVDEANPKDMDFENMMSQMGQFNTGEGPPGGAEEPESDDSDDDELPDLE